QLSPRRAMLSAHRQLGADHEPTPITRRAPLPPRRRTRCHRRHLGRRSSGSQQSPIDLAGAADRDLTNPEIAYQPGEATVVDNGHTVEVDIGGTSIITVDGTPYRLVQAHFHSP